MPHTGEPHVQKPCLAKDSPLMKSECIMLLLFARSRNPPDSVSYRYGNLRADGQAVSLTRRTAGLFIQMQMTNALSTPPSPVTQTPPPPLPHHTTFTIGGSSSSSSSASPALPSLFSRAAAGGPRGVSGLDHPPSLRAGRPLGVASPGLITELLEQNDVRRGRSSGEGCTAVKLCAQRA